MCAADRDLSDAVQHLDRRPTPGQQAAFAYISADVVSPYPQRTVGLYCGGPVDTGRGLPHACYHSDGYIAADDIGAVAELSSVVPAPCPKSAVVAHGQGVTVPGVDTTDAVHDFLRPQAGRAGAVAELALVVVAPGPHGAVFEQRHGEVEPGGYLPYVVKHLDRPTAELCSAVAELAPVVEAESPQGAVLLEHQAETVACGDGLLVASAEKRGGGENEKRKREKMQVAVLFHLSAIFAANIRIFCQCGQAEKEFMDEPCG